MFRYFKKPGMTSLKLALVGTSILKFSTVHASKAAEGAISVNLGETPVTPEETPEETPAAQNRWCHNPCSRGSAVTEFCRNVSRKCSEWANKMRRPDVGRLENAESESERKAIPDESASDIGNAQETTPMDDEKDPPVELLQNMEKDDSESMRKLLCCLKSCCDNKFSCRQKMMVAVEKAMKWYCKPPAIRICPEPAPRRPTYEDPSLSSTCSSKNKTKRRRKRNREEKSEESETFNIGCCQIQKEDGTHEQICVVAYKGATNLCCKVIKGTLWLLPRVLATPPALLTLLAARMMERDENGDCTNLCGSTIRFSPHTQEVLDNHDPESKTNCQLCLGDTLNCCRNFWTCNWKYEPEDYDIPALRKKYFDEPSKANCCDKFSQCLGKVMSILCCRPCCKEIREEEPRDLENGTVVPVPSEPALNQFQRQWLTQKTYLEKIEEQKSEQR